MYGRFSDYDIAKHRSTIVQLYIVFIFTLIIGFIPNSYTQGLSLALLLILMIAVPMYGVSAPQGSILKSHMRYLNGTIWKGSTFLLIGAGLVMYWVYKGGDHSAIAALQDQVQAGTLVSEDSIYNTIDAYMNTNFWLILKAAIICIGPPLLYMLMRILRALGCAAAGDHVE